MRITLDSVKGKLLKTARTVIAEDIEVVPQLEERTFTEGGTYTPGEGYAGFGEITVAIAGGGGSGSWAGVFDETVTYYGGHIVYYAGGIYEKISHTTTKPYPTDTTAWKKLADVVSGITTIHANGTHDVTDFKTVHVAVPDENNWEGAYESGIAYKLGALVVYSSTPYNYAVYLAIQDTDGTQAPTDEEYWDKLTTDWNDTSSATASEDDVVDGLTFFAGGEKKTGTMMEASDATFSSLTVVASGEGRAAIQYFADANTYILNNKGSTRAGVIGTVSDENFLEENIADGVTLFGLTGKHGSTPIFDGTITIESGFTTISGCYRIDESKAYRALSLLPANRTYIVDFSAGSYINGEQEKKGFISMTFNTDGDKSIIYGRADSSITAFSSSDHMTGGYGFAPYYNAYEEGNGAMVNFYEGTVCRRDFKELFLSIADVNDLAPTLISFTIGGTSYTAEDGMTWEEWVDSEYNTAGFTCSGENSSVYNTEGTHYVSRADGYVEGGVAIEANCAYTLVIVSGTN